jgi:hypothetical protein
MLMLMGMLAQDAQLDALRSTLIPLREHANDRLSNDHDDARGATPALTLAKHQLRDWIETRLARFPENGDITALAAEFHAGLRDAHLFCDDCFPSFRGFVDEVQVDREREFLVVRTSAGIWCGYDDSAYVYRWVAGRWKRIWAEEQNDYSSHRYFPQVLYAVHISPPLVLTLGSRPGCSVAFQPVYYGVWRLGRPKALLKGSEFAYVGEFPPIKGRVGPDDALIAFTVGGTGYGQGHEVIRHYRLRGKLRNGGLEQVDPIAPTPRDFVEEWLAANWKRSADWSESPSLKAWHTKMHRNDGTGDFPDATLRCGTRGDLWQVGIRQHDVPDETWYLVRWKQQDQHMDHFRMVGISERPDPDCERGYNSQ